MAIPHCRFDAESYESRNGAHAYGHGNDDNRQRPCINDRVLRYNNYTVWINVSQVKRLWSFGTFSVRSILAHGVRIQSNDIVPSSCILTCVHQRIEDKEWIATNGRCRTSIQSTEPLDGWLPIRYTAFTNNTLTHSQGHSIHSWQWISVGAPSQFGWCAYWEFRWMGRTWPNYHLQTNAKRYALYAFNKIAGCVLRCCAIRFTACVRSMTMELCAQSSGDLYLPWWFNQHVQYCLFDELTFDCIAMSKSRRGRSTANTKTKRRFGSNGWQVKTLTLKRRRGHRHAGGMMHEVVKQN